MHKDTTGRPAGGRGGEANQPRASAANAPAKGERIAKRLARAGLCSRREAETWIAAGRIAVNGRVLATPAVTVGPDDRIEVDGKPLGGCERTRLWLFHKPAGLVTTSRDPEGRPTVFSALPAGMPRVVTVGRLDINTEGLILLTNDGGLARMLELPETGWLRRYRVRAHGRVTQAQLDALKEGVAVDGILYGPIEATIDREQGSNVWLTVGLREGKNREVKKVLASLGLSVNRLIRVSYGPFQLGDLAHGEVREIRGRTLRDQLGERLIRLSGADFEAPIIATVAAAEKPQEKAAGPDGRDKQRRERTPREQEGRQRPGTGKPARDARPQEKPQRKKAGAPGPAGRQKGGAGASALDRLDTKPRRRPSGQVARPGGKRDADRRR